MKKIIHAFIASFLIFNSVEAINNFTFEAKFNDEKYSLTFPELSEKAESSFCYGYNESDEVRYRIDIIQMPEDDISTILKEIRDDEDAEFCSFGKWRDFLTLDFTSKSFMNSKQSTRCIATKSKLYVISAFYDNAYPFSFDDFKNIQEGIVLDNILGNEINTNKSYFKGTIDGKTNFLQLENLQNFSIAYDVEDDDVIYSIQIGEYDPHLTPNEALEKWLDYELDEDNCSSNYSQWNSFQVLDVEILDKDWDGRNFDQFHVIATNRYLCIINTWSEYGKKTEHNNLIKAFMID